MAKEVKTKVRMQIAAGGASPAAVGSSLGPHGINGAEFCKQFNSQTASRSGETVPTIITIYKDRTFDFILKTALASELILKKAGVPKGSPNPKDQKIGKISWDDVADIANAKMVDLNAFDLEQAKKIIAGTARSMGIEVV